MMKQTRTRTPLLMALLIIVGALSTQQSLFGGQATTNLSGFEEFGARMENYEKVHKAAEKSLPALKKKSKPDVIVAHQEAMVSKLRELRKDAKRGDIFTPAATESIAREIKAVYAGSDGRGIRTTILAGEPLAGFKVEVNQRYPDNLPITTMPPTLLQKLPRLPDELVFRIIGSTLLLVDRRANLIIDFMPNAIP